MAGAIQSLRLNPGRDCHVQRPLWMSLFRCEHAGPTALAPGKPPAAFDDLLSRFYGQGRRSWASAREPKKAMPPSPAISGVDPPALATAPQAVR